MQLSIDDAVSIQDLTLPYAWDKANKGLQGRAEFELVFDLDAKPNEPWGIFIQRAGNAYAVWLNGALLQRQGDLEVSNSGDFSQVPRYVTVPPELLEKFNVLRVEIRADSGRKGGLTPLRIGPQSEVLPLYERSYLIRGTASMLIAGFSFLVGFLSLVLWVTHRNYALVGPERRDRLYLYAALAELFWSFGVGYMFFEVPWIPWPWWGVLPIVAVAFWVGFTALFCIEAAGWASRPGFQWFKHWLLALVALMPVLAFVALAFSMPLVLTVGYATLGLTNLCFAFYLLVKSFRQAVLVQKMLAVAVTVNVLVGFRDIFVYRLDPSYNSITWLRYSSLLFGFCVVYLVLSRFYDATKKSQQLTQTLVASVAAKELELSGSYQKLEALARQQERSTERTRILRDMHDGVGAHISTAIRQLQSGQAKDDEVLLTLRESLDQLKLSIDAMTLPAGDVTGLLANLRYRMEPRFKASDLELQWDVELLEPLPRLDDKAMRSLQFLVYGTIANVLQHAGATVLRMEARALAQGVQIVIADNGCGFDTSLPKRKGLLSMEERARAMGARLDIQSSPGGTSVEITIV